MVYTYDDLYIAIAKDVLKNGTWVKDNVRTKYADGTPAYYKQLLGVAFCITPEMGVPILRSKFVGQKHPLIELDWIWRTRSNDVKWLNDRNVHIWDNWVMEPKWSNRQTIGRAYGYQLENNKRTLADDKGNSYLINQVDYVLHELKHNPNSRRIVTSLLDIEDTAYMALEPCVWATTWSVEGDTVHLQVKQRSSDLALGNPYNVYQYYVLLHLIAYFTGFKPGNLYWYVDNMHIYDRHIDVLKEQIANYEKEPNTDILTLSMANIEGETFDTYDFSNITVPGYTHKGKYRYEVAE